jgi:hypothetical protein
MTEQCGLCTGACQRCGGTVIKNEAWVSPPTREQIPSAEAGRCESFGTRYTHSDQHGLHLFAVTRAVSETIDETDDR